MGIDLIEFDDINCSAQFTSRPRKSALVTQIMHSEQGFVHPDTKPDEFRTSISRPVLSYRDYRGPNPFLSTGCPSVGNTGAPLPEPDNPKPDLEYKFVSRSVQDEKSKSFVTTAVDKKHGNAKQKDGPRVPIEKSKAVAQIEDNFVKQVTKPKIEKDTPEIEDEEFDLAEKTEILEQRTNNRPAKIENPSSVVDIAVKKKPTIFRTMLSPLPSVNKGKSLYRKVLQKSANRYFVRPSVQPIPEDTEDELDAEPETNSDDYEAVPNSFDFQYSNQLIPSPALQWKTFESSPVDVTVRHMASLDHFFVTFDAKEPIRKNLIVGMTGWYKIHMKRNWLGDPLTSEDVAVNCYYAAFLPIHKTWNRVFILEKLPIGQVRVVFIDVGIEMQLWPKDIRRLLSIFCELPILAFHARAKVTESPDFPTPDELAAFKDLAEGKSFAAVKVFQTVTLPEFKPHSTLSLVLFEVDSRRKLQPFNFGGRLRLGYIVKPKKAKEK